MHADLGLENAYDIAPGENTTALKSEGPATGAGHSSPNDRHSSPMDVSDAQPFLPGSAAPPLLAPAGAPQTFAPTFVPGTPRHSPRQDAHAAPLAPTVPSEPMSPAPAPAPEAWPSPAEAARPMSRKERRLAKHRAETHDLTKADSPPAPSPSPPSFDQGPWFQHGDIQQFGSPADVPELDADEVAGEVVPIASQGTSVNVPGTPEDDELASPPPLPPVAAASAQIRRAAQDDVPLQIRRALAPQQAALPAPASWQRMPREARHVDPTET